MAKSKKLLFALVPLVALGTAAFVAKAGGLAKPQAPVPVLTNVGSYLTNLAGLDEHYIKVGLEVQVSSAQAATQLNAQHTAVSNIVLRMLHNETLTEASSSNAMQVMGAALTQRLQPLLTDGRILKVYFTQFLIE